MTIVYSIVRLRSLPFNTLLPFRYIFVSQTLCSSYSFLLHMSDMDPIRTSIRPVTFQRDWSH